MVAATLPLQNEFKVRPVRSCSATAVAVFDRAVATPLPTRLFRVAFASVGNLVAAGSEDGRAWVWDLDSGRRLFSLLGPDTTVRDVAFVGGYGLLAFAGGNWLRREGVLKLWALQNPGSAEILWRHNRPITALAVSPDSNRLTAGSGDGLLRTWNLASGAEVPAVQAHDDEITSLAYSPDGRTLVSAGADQLVRIWDAQLNPRRSLRGHERVVSNLAFAPDGLSVASIDDQTILLWDVIAGRVIQRRVAPSGRFRGVAFAADANSLITVGNSQPARSEVRAWDLSQPTGKIIRRHEGVITSLGISPDSSRIAATDDQGAVHLWSAR